MAAWGQFVRPIWTAQAHSATTELTSVGVDLPLWARQWTVILSDTVAGTLDVDVWNPIAETYLEIDAARATVAVGSSPAVGNQVTFDFWVPRFRLRFTPSAADASTLNAVAFFTPTGHRS